MVVANMPMPRHEFDSAGIRSSIGEAASDRVVVRMRRMVNRALQRIRLGESGRQTNGPPRTQDRCLAPREIPHNVRVLYASCACSYRRFFQTFTNYEEMPGQQVQKYHRLMAQGLAGNGARVEMVTALPISRSNSKRLLVAVRDDIAEGVQYHYLPVINIPGIRNLVAALGSFAATSNRLMRDESAVVVCDALNVSVATGAILAAKLQRRVTVGIVTDIPIFLDPGKKSFRTRAVEQYMNRFDLYVLLTHEMSQRVNTRGAPYIVLEGQVDSNMAQRENQIDLKYPRKVCLYSGSIDKKYGVRALVQGFIAAGCSESELHIYGSGDFEDELATICANHESIKYFGTVANEQVVTAQMSATLLVNPRPTSDEYTRYSFPSKNLEYMVSGTPLATTRLPGMPGEYLPYVYILDDESAEGIASMLRTLLAMPAAELHESGLAGRAYVLEHKSNLLQARRVLDMIDKRRSGLP